jgi:hypothetical protein
MEGARYRREEEDPGGMQKNMVARWEVGGGDPKNVAAVGSETVGLDSKCALEQKNCLSIGYVAFFQSKSRTVCLLLQIIAFVALDWLKQLGTCKTPC